MTLADFINRHQPRWLLDARMRRHNDRAIAALLDRQLMPVRRMDESADEYRDRLKALVQVV